METNIWMEISKIKNNRRKAYFQWQNKIENIKVNYAEMTEDDFIAYCSKSQNGKAITNREEFLAWQKRWESTAEYKRLVCLLKEDSFATDILSVYEQVKVKALDGDSQAIKNMLLLQGEIKNYRKSIDDYFKADEEELEVVEVVEEVEEVEKDDGLII